MAGRRWIAKDAVASMAWWCLIILAIGGCRGVLAAESAAMDPSATEVRGEEGGCICDRPLSDVIWGFLITLLALTASLWGSTKYRGNQDKLGMCAGMCLAFFDPLEDLGLIIIYSLRCISLLWNCHNMKNPNSRMTNPSWLKFLCSSVFPWSKSPARILASCEIVVYVSKESPLLEKKWLWTEGSVADESEALVVGENGARAIRNDLYQREELSEEGIGLLVWREFFSEAQDSSKRLPKYDELKYLRGNSGIAFIAIGVQAFGYIYAIAFRDAKNLRISPLEVIGLVFNVILLIKVLLYSNPCHRPLVIYMDADWEDEVVKFNDDDLKKFGFNEFYKIHLVIYFGIFIGLITLLICCIVNIAKTTNVSVVLPIIAYLFGLSLGFLGLRIIHVDKNSDQVRGVFIGGIGFLVTAIAYIWAIVATIYYWRTMHFNTRGDLINLSQIIPFIG